MQINDNLSNGVKKSTNIKTPHMFQKTYEESTFSNDFDQQVTRNMSKIAKSFKSDQNTSQFENDKSLLVSTNKLIDINLLDSTKSLYEYFEELRNIVNPQEEETLLVEDIVDLEDEEEVITDEKINIEELIKDSERVIFNTNDKRTLLKELINDVSSNSVVNFTYDDEKFEQNIKEMLSEEKEDPNNQDTILIEAVEPIIDSAQNIKRSKTSIFLIVTIVVLLGVAFYIYKDQILGLLP